jgi:hypothetical protein
MLRVTLRVKDNGLGISLGRSISEIPKMANDELEQFMSDVVEDVKPYAPTTAANSPPPPYYERGVGYYGKYGTLTKPSEQLGTRWGFEANPSNTGMEGLIFNRASYSGYVQEEGVQASWHAQRGWKTVQQSVVDVAGTNSLARIAENIINKIKNFFK